jgi:hypothetical protein
MKPEDQIKALAKLDGCDCADWGMTRCTDDCSSQGKKPYITSYDCIIPLIQKQPVEIKQAIHKLVFELIAFKSHRFDATPSQLAKAMLRATGKWKETL